MAIFFKFVDGPFCYQASDPDYEGLDVKMAYSFEKQQDIIL